MRDEERLPATLVHALAAIPLWGVVGDCVVWLLYKERSREVVFHAQQAILFQVCVLGLGLVSVVVALFGRVLSVISDDFSRSVLQTNLLLLKVGLVFYVCICLYGAFVTWTGRRFLYPVLGEKMAQGFRSSSERM